MKLVRNAAGNFPEQVHEIFTEEGKQGSYDYLFQLLKADFFPFETAESMWLITCDGKEAFLLRQSERITSYGSFSSLKMGGEFILQAVYFQNGAARAEYLFKEFGGAGIEMYFAGRWEEYQSYRISTKAETQWAEKWGVSLEDKRAAVNSNVMEAYDLLSLIMRRPGMFVGSHRVDLAQIYFNGWKHHQKCMWDISYDLECWLFRTEGIMFTGSIQAWSLFYAYFGAEDIGVQKFREFLADTRPTSCIALHTPASITWQIGSLLYSFNRQYCEIYGLTEYCDFDLDEEGITQERMAAQVLRLVRRLLPGFSEQIKIYINKRSLYCQVRIFIRKGGEWVDGVDVCTGEADMKQLVVLHAYLHNAVHWHENQIVVIISEGEHLHWELKPYDAPHHPYVLKQAPEELLMYRQFEQWVSQNVYL